ncbi:MAG: YbhB/YbcL family Raf kinase inhibitor-like protein [Desulfitobacteriaceae bacterium]
MFKKIKIKRTYCLLAFLLIWFLVGSTIIPQGIQQAAASELPLQPVIQFNEQVEQEEQEEQVEQVDETFMDQSMPVQVNDLPDADLLRAERERSLARESDQTVTGYSYGPAQVQGTVKTVAGETAKGGSVRIENVDEYDCYVNVEIDDQGNYSAGGLPAGFYYIQAKPASLYDEGNTEFPSITQMIELKDDDSILTQPLRFTKAEVEGTVTDPNNNIAKNTEVEIYNQYINQYEWFYVDENGHYDIGGLPSGTYTINARSWQGYDTGYFDSLPQKITIKANNPDDSAMTAQTVNLQLTTKELQGKVTDKNNNPIEAEIYITSDTTGNGNWFYTDDQNKGNYAFGGLPTGDYTIIALVNYKAYTQPQKVHIEQGKVQNLNLSEGSTQLSGKIKLYNGATPSKEFKIYIRPLHSDSEDNYYCSYRDLTTINASYQIGCLLDGDYVITVYSPDYSNYADVTKVVNINSKKQTTLDLTLPKPMFSGTVKNPDDSIAYNSRVYIYPKKWDSNSFTYWTNILQDGKYAFGGLPDGDYNLYVYPSNNSSPYTPYTRSYTQQIKISGGKATNFTDNLKLTIPTVKGRVLDPNGLPVSSVNAKLFKDKSYWGDWTGNGGSFKFGGVPDGSYTLNVEVPDGETWVAPEPVPITLKAGQTLVKTLQFSSSSTLTISSTDPQSNSENVDPSKNITVTYSKNLSQGNSFKNICLKDADNKTVTTKNSIKDNTLTLKPKSTLNFGTNYIVTIPAGAVKDNKGNTLSDDYTFSFTTMNKPDIPDVPINLTSTNVTATQLTLNWDEVSGATTYNVYRSISSIGPFKKIAAVSSNTCIDKGLKASTPYYYYVTAFNSAGEGKPSSTLTVTTKALAPTGLSAKSISSKEILLSWKGGTSGKYNVYRSDKQDGEYQLIAEQLTKASYNNTDLQTGTTYWYQVTVLNGADIESAASTPISSTTKATGPANLQLEVISSSEIDLTWNSVDGAKSYNIYLSTKENGPFSKVSSVKATNSATIAFQNKKLKPGITYWYKVTTVNKTGESDYSTVVTGSTHLVMKLNSTVFKSNQKIPVKYANTVVKNGQNISIPLFWTGVPLKTQSLALIMYDMDYNNAAHWSVINIPADVLELAEGASQKSMPVGTVELGNGFGETGYTGPFPPTGKTHKYKLAIYALDTDNINTVDSVANFSDFNTLIKGHVLGSSELIGKFINQK